MFKQTLFPDTFRAIQLTSQIPVIQRAYLAGGTALALQIGHRMSVDLDFFTQEVFDENMLGADLKRFSEFKLGQKAWRTIMGHIGETAFSLFYYEYPMLDKTESFEGIHLAGKKDIAAMKMHALADRGTKRDFIDMYFLAKEYSLDKILEFYDLKYGNLKEQFYHIVRALDYFADAEHEERSLQMLINVDWEEVKKFFETEAKRLARERLGIS